MHAHIYVHEKRLQTTTDGEYMEVTVRVSVLNCRPAKVDFAVDKSVYDRLEVGKTYELHEFPAVVTTVEAVELTEKTDDTLPPAAPVPQCGAFEACELPLGHEGPHVPDASARESTPEGEPTQGVEAVVATL